MLSALSVALTLPALVSGSCSNGCGARGFCTTAFTCQCQDGFYGPECTERTCPKGRQWQGYATSVDTVHEEEVACSNMGVCDRGSGKCKCHASFDGKACERLACPAGQCNGHGKCRSLAEAAEEVDNWHLLVSTTYSLWDKDKIHGCVCDKGWRGYDCSERECMYGDDPMTVGGSEEVQVMECTCAATCSGGVVLDVYGEKTGLIAHDASAADVVNAFKVRERYACAARARAPAQRARSHPPPLLSLSLSLSRPPAAWWCCRRSTQCRTFPSSFRAQQRRCVLPLGLPPSLTSRARLGTCRRCWCTARSPRRLAGAPPRSLSLPVARSARLIPSTQSMARARTWSARTPGSATARRGSAFAALGWYRATARAAR